MNWGLIWRGLQKSKMRNKVLAVFGILLVYRVLAHIPLPLAEPEQLKILIENILGSDNLPQYLSLINLLSGGALASLSIMLVGLGPYINASIIMQVLAKAVPRLETIQKDGEAGRRKISQYTRILTVPLALVQSILALFLVRPLIISQYGSDILAQSSLSHWILLILVLTAGAVILMWLGELITERKLGNGISLLIVVAIISQLPVLISEIKNSLVSADETFSIFGWFSLPTSGQALLYSSLLIGFTLLVTIFVVYLNEAQRRIKISYAKKIEGNRAYSDVSTHLPLKLAAAGVIPIIFAIAFLTMPQIIGQLLEGASAPWGGIGQRLTEWFSPPGLEQTGPGIFSDPVNLIYPITYFLLVVGFTYFYTNVIISSKDIAENLQRQGGFIGGIRPGKATEKYLSRVVNRLNFFGAVALGFLALTPILAQGFLRVRQLTLGGTSILILVAVALEVLRQVESNALVATYQDSAKLETAETIQPATKAKRKPTLAKIVKTKPKDKKTKKKRWRK